MYNPRLLDGCLPPREVAAPGFAGQIGRKIRIGDALLEITGGCKDCVATYASGQGEGDHSLLVGLATVRGGHLGVVARAVEGHRLRTGDPVVLLD